MLKALLVNQQDRLASLGFARLGLLALYLIGVLKDTKLISPAMISRRK